MDSTKTLTLTLNCGDSSITLTLGDDLSEVISQLTGYKVERSEDPELRRAHLELPGLGVELMFADGALAAVFLHLTDEGIGMFTGSTNLLSREVIASLDPAAFAAALLDQGFTRPAKQYPFATDLLNEGLRVRLERRDDRALMLIDDGARLRGAPASSTAGVR